MNIQRTSRLFLLGIVLALLSLVEARAAVLQSGRAYAFSMPAEWRYASESVATLMQQRTGISLTIAHADSAMLKIVHDAALGSEAYTLQIADNDIMVRAASVCNTCRRVRESRDNGFHDVPLRETSRVRVANPDCR